jgi:uncharacterized protein YceK
MEFVHETLALSLLAAASLLLSGCASVIESNVTSFHAWSPDYNQRAYAFAPAKEQENDLQYQNYAGLIRQELQFLGFTEARDRRRRNCRSASATG